MNDLNRILIIVLLWVGSNLQAQTAPPLTVVVVIDQFPMYLVDQNNDLFGEDGFKRLEREGMLYSECRYSHAVLETGPGHATIATGCNPRTHGIVANGWQRADGSDVYCVECAGVHPVTDSGISDTLDSYCPDNLLLDGLSDLWNKTYGDGAKIWSLSLKDRAAVAMGGKKPDGAIWLNRGSGTFETSTYYTNALPAWCSEYNKTAGLYFAETWTRNLKPEAYFHCDTDNAWYEDGTKAGLTNTLPKKLSGGETTPGRGYARAMQATPFGNDWLYGLVEECISAEKLGKDNTPDLLWVSFSSNDICGHIFGPHSHEICDMTVRTDKLIAEFLNLLDQKIGKGKYWLALTADHGVCPPHESSLMPSGVGGRFALDKMKIELQDHLAQKFLNGILPMSGLISALEIPTVYLNQKSIADAKLDLREVATATAIWLGSQPGVSQAVVSISAEDVSAIADSQLRSHIEQSFHAERFSQVYLHPQPYWQSDGICSNHGAIHDYDTHVPLYFFGKPFTGGRLELAADPSDLVTVLASSAGLTWASERDGKLR